MGTIALKATAGGSVQLKADDALTTDEEVVVPSGGFNDGIGVNQTWQGVAASRAFDTTYTNTTDKPIQVCINVAVKSGGDARLLLETFDVSVMLSDSTTYEYHTVFFIVPAGGIYHLKNNAGIPIINRWHELRGA